MNSGAVSRRDVLRFGLAASATAFAGSAGSAEEAEVAGSGFTDDGLAAWRARIEAAVAAGNVPGAVGLLARGDDVQVVAAGRMSIGGAPMRRDALFRIASLTKPVTATAAMILVDGGKLKLDAPVDPFLPELARRRVLKAIDGPLDETVRARRAITLRDLLTLRFGLGAIMVWPPKHPIQAAQAEQGVSPGFTMFSGTSDEMMQAVGSLPLVHQPGEGWLYHTGMDVAAVLVERVADKSFGEFCRERIFEPLGMADTGFVVAPDKRDRLPDIYRSDGKGGLVSAAGELGGGDPTVTPKSELGGGNLVSTADDYLAFCRMLLAKGAFAGGRILSEASVADMTRDQLTAEQRNSAPMFFGDHSSWGLGMAVSTKRTNPWNVPGRFGWDGGYGTSAYVDPETGLIGIMMTQRMMDSPEPPVHWVDFWRSAYDALA